MSESSQPMLQRTVKAAGTITARRFVGFDNLQITVQANSAKGVSRDDAVIGDVIAVTMMGTETLESGGAFAVGDDIYSDTSGRAITIGSPTTQKRNGVAMEASGGAGEFVEIFLVK